MEDLETMTFFQDLIVNAYFQIHHTVCIHDMIRYNKIHIGIFFMNKTKYLFWNEFHRIVV